MKTYQNLADFADQEKKACLFSSLEYERKNHTANGHLTNLYCRHKERRQ